MTAHWKDCRLIHPPCALAYIAMLESEIRQLRREREYAPVPCGDNLTHDVVLPLHGEGPTWAHANDEPPCR